MKHKADFIAPLSKTKLHEEIVAQLKDKIICGEFESGMKLPPERELAHGYQVNRSTLREALNKLEGMGLVEKKHGHGVFVKDYLESGSLELVKQLLVMDGRLNLKMFPNLMELRRLVVPEISYYAAVNRTPEDLKALEQIVMKDTEMSMAEKDRRIHNLIARASGNILFVILLNAFSDLAREPALSYFDVPENRKRSALFHKAIYKAIKEKKPEKAKKIMLEVLIFAERATCSALGIDTKGRKNKYRERMKKR